MDDKLCDKITVIYSWSISYIFIEKQKYFIWIDIIQQIIVYRNTLQNTSWHKLYNESWKFYIVTYTYFWHETKSQTRPIRLLCFSKSTILQHPQSAKDPVIHTSILGCFKAILISHEWK